MRVLIIGAGAIGQVFGRHFQAGGADLGFLLRPRQVEEAKAGFAMYPLDRPASQRDVPIRFQGFAVYDDQATALEEPWDLIVTAVSSVALRKGTWLADLAKAMGQTPLLALQAGPEDDTVIYEHLPKERVAWAMLSITSYQAPLPGQQLPEPGVAYWIAPPNGIEFSGAPDIVDPMVKILKKGKMRLRVVSDARAGVAFNGALLDKIIIALECAGWSFAELRKHPDLLDLAFRAMRESWALAELTTGQRTPFELRLIRPFLLRIALVLAPKLLPLDLERFFKFHYTKVAEQTLMIVTTQLRQHEEQQVDCPASTELVGRLRALRGA